MAGMCAAGAAAHSNTAGTGTAGVPKYLLLNLLLGGRVWTGGAREEGRPCAWPMEAFSSHMARSRVGNPGAVPLPPPPPPPPLPSPPATPLPSSRRPLPRDYQDGSRVDPSREPSEPEYQPSRHPTHHDMAPRLPLRPTVRNMRGPAHSNRTAFVPHHRVRRPIVLSSLSSWSPRRGSSGPPTPRKDNSRRR